MSLSIREKKSYLTKKHDFIVFSRGPNSRTYCCDELVHILGERELNVLYYRLMNVTVNPFILASVNDTLSQFNFILFTARFQTKLRLKHTVNRL